MTKTTESIFEEFQMMNTYSLDKYILHVDEHLIVINKPAGLRVIPDGFQPSLPNLRDMLNAIYAKVWVVHRLDKETSGILLFARDAATHRHLNHQFENRTIKKKYLLIAIGKPDWQTMTVNLPLRTNGDRKHRTVIDFENGKPAKTEFSIIEGFLHHALLSASPHSGYTHQIRTHISAAGFPILGDLLYWQPAAHLSHSKNQRPGPVSPPSIDRVALHAAQITILDHATDSPRRFTAKPPDDFINCLDKLRLE